MIVLRSLSDGQVRQQNLSMRLGQVLMALRQARKLTLEQVALEASVDAGHLSRIERGQKLPSIDALERIAAALGSSRSAIFAAMEEKPADAVTSALAGLAEPDYSSEAIQLRQGFVSLSQENKTLVIDFVRLLSRRQADAP